MRSPARLPPGLSGAASDAAGASRSKRCWRRFTLNLTALSWIALIVGLFLVYNTVTISVVARREEIGTLRALGVTRSKVLALFLGEAAVLAVAGIAIGLGLARLLADAAVTLTSATVSTLYIAAVAAPPADDDWTLWPSRSRSALPLSLLAAAVPALEASRVPPTAAMRGHDTLEMRVRFNLTPLVIAVVFLAVAYALAQLAADRPAAGTSDISRRSRS